MNIKPHYQVLHNDIIKTAVATLDRSVRLVHIQHTPNLCLHQEPMSGFFFYLLIMEGSAELLINCRPQSFHKNDLILIAPSMAFRFTSTSHDFHAIGLYMEISFFDSLQLGSFAYMQLFATQPTKPAITLEAQELGSIKKTMEVIADAITLCGAQEMLSHLTNFLSLRIVEILRQRNLDTPATLSRPDELYRQFRKMLAKDYRKGHSISYYAERLHVSEAYLSRAVRKASGKTVNHYITTTLINNAKHDLIFSDANIKEIAENLGFADQSSFGKFFKKEAGLSPMMFRNSHAEIRPSA
ncbi:MAG: AraC family transcriptional regulator [Prevotella sp.]|nr:AraC family transcriptional regulator [Prevotella sp.]